MSTIYILKCQQNKYYIGKTKKTPEKRFYQHVNGSATLWTTKYKPTHIVEIIKNASSWDEDKYTKMYMYKYGINNVRGGSYTKIKLSQNEINYIIKEFQTANDLCYKCGSSSHYSNNCKSLHYNFLPHIIILSVWTLLGFGIGLLMAKK